MFFINISFLFAIMSPTALVFPKERQVFLKEEGSKLYSALSYFISRSTIEAGYILILPTIFLNAFYWLIGLAATTEQFFLFYFMGILIAFCGNSLGLLLGCIIEDEKSVGAVMPLVLIPFIVLSGYFKNLDSIPKWISWAQYISPFKYGFSAML